MLRFHSPPSSIFQKSQSTNPLPGSPMVPIWRELPISRVFFYMSLGFLSKSSPDRKISLFSQSPWERRVPSMFPKMGPLWKQTSVSRALPNTSFWVPSKGALPSGSSQRSHTVRDAPFPDTFLICLSKSLVNEPPPGFPVGPLWRVMPISKAFSYPSLFPGMEPPLIELL